MAKRSGTNRTSGIHEMESGLLHWADSLAGGVRGVFVDRFGPPDSPTTRETPSRDCGIAGKAPDLHKKFFGKQGR